MSRTTTSKHRVLAGVSLAVLALFVPAPAYAAATSQATGTPTSGSTPARAASPSGSASHRAAVYIAGALKGGDHVEGPSGPNLGQTADVALGLSATSGQRATLDKVLSYLEANADDYVHGTGFGDTGKKGGDGQANYAGPTGKLALVAQLTGRDPSSFGGIDLVTELRGQLATSGKSAGRFRDDSGFGNKSNPLGDFSNPLGQAFDILALERGTKIGAPKAAVDFLVAAQCSDGGFPDAFGAATCTSTPDATGLALQALVATDAGCSASSALTWLKDHRAANGSYGSNAVDPTKAAVGNVNSSAYAALGLAAARASTTKVVAYLSSVQNADGGLPIEPSGSDKGSDVYATAQALVALARTSFLTIGPNPVAPQSPTCSQPANAGEVLPRTGSDVLAPLAGGGLLLALGVALVLAGRRRAGRHA